MSGMDDPERVTVLEARHLLGLDFNEAGQICKAIADGEIPSTGEVQREPWHLVRLSDVEAWLSAKGKAAS